MLRGYEDITKRLGEPLWWDDNGVPRYEEFHPEMCGIYDRYVAFAEVACQSCRKKFLVSIERDMMNRLTERDMPRADNPWSWHYGDPPRHGECCSGNTMNTIELRILQFWRRQPAEDWERLPQYEIDFEQDDE